MPRYWFKPKRIGYGATPITWQGWVSVAVFAVAFVLGAMQVVSTLELARTGAVATWVFVVVGAALLAALIGFIRFTAFKTDGEWRWRWNGDDPS